MSVADLTASGSVMIQETLDFGPFLDFFGIKSAAPS